MEKNQKAIFLRLSKTPIFNFPDIYYHQSSRSKSNKPFSRQGRIQTGAIDANAPVKIEKLERLCTKYITLQRKDIVCQNSRYLMYTFLQQTQA